MGFKKIIVWLTGLVLLFLSMMWGWSRISPTRILLVNFRDWQAAEHAAADESAFIHLESVDIRDGKRPELEEYDFVLFFGMGLHLTPEQQESIRKAALNGVSFYVYASSSPDNRIDNLKGRDLDKVKSYLNNGGESNIKELFNYIRIKIDGKSFMTHPIKEAVKIPGDVYFHAENGQWFPDIQSYREFYKKSGRFSSTSPNILILTSNLGALESSTGAPFQALIKELEKKKFNVYAAGGFSGRLEKIREVSPQAVIYFAHGRLAPGLPDSALNLLKEKNIPLLSPLVIHEDISEWMKRQQGMTGGMLSQSVTAPEIDGAVYPYVIGGLAPGKNGFNVFVPIPERVERFAKIVENMIELRKTPNSRKKIAIVYYKGPGKNALQAAGLETVPSLWNLLRMLKAHGYHTGELPGSPKELMEMIQAKGPVLGKYAKGSIDKFLNEKEIVFIHDDTLKQWMNENIPSELIDEMEKRYGPCPGDYLVKTEGESRRLTLPCVKFGNVAILPQLMPAFGDDTFKIIHGAKQVPPYSYAATYLWARESFKARALIHFGTHGSLEFTPWKQSALSSYDWPDILIGDLPHFYLYTINNIGEALIAKRRSYAALISHITPPFKRSGLSGDLRELHHLIHRYLTAENESLKARQLMMIKELALKTGLDNDLDLNLSDDGKFDSLEMEKIHHYVHAVDGEKITNGLYTMGEPYLKDEVAATVESIFSEELAYSLAEMDLYFGTITKKQRDDSHYFDENYVSPAREKIKEILKGRSRGSFLTPARLAEYEKLKSFYKPMGNMDAMGLMISMSSLKGREEKENQNSMSKDELVDIVSRLSADSSSKEQLLKLKDDDKFSRMFMLTHEEGLAKAEKLARFIPPMKKGIDFFKTPGVSDLIIYMKDKTNRDEVFALLSSEALREKVKAAKKEKIRKTVAWVNGLETRNLIKEVMNCRGEEFVQGKSASEIKEILKKIDKVLHLDENVKQDGSLDLFIRNILNGNEGASRLAGASRAGEKAYEKRKALEERFMEAARSASELKREVLLAQEAVEYCGENEMKGLMNALAGGYVCPSTGGDPVYNPSSLPTGRNLYGLDAKSAPGKDAWEAGKKIEKDFLDQYYEKNGKYPKKIAYTLWGGEFIRDQGLTLARILYLLGVEPVANSMGRVHNVRLIPMEELNRPRIDVVVQTSGQFRDLAPSRLDLINKGVKIAAAAKDHSRENYVKKGVLDAERLLKEKGLSPLEAKELAFCRVFGGVNGNYGTGITGLVEQGHLYDSDSLIGERYLKNMGAVYGGGYWGDFRPGVFEAGLLNTEIVTHSRSSHTTGPLSLDHVYEFMGGLSSAIKKVTGTDPEGYIQDNRQRHHRKNVGLKEAIWRESRSTVLNPNYIKPLLEGGSSSAAVFAETVRNAFGWNAVKKSVIDEELWDSFYRVYVEDSLKLGVEEFFNRENPYALQEISAVMLESVRKGFWSPEKDKIAKLSKLHTRLIKDHEAACSGFVCNNPKLREFVKQSLDPQMKKEYEQALDQVRSGESLSKDENAITLKKKEFSKNLNKLGRKNKTVLIIAVIVILVLVLPFMKKRKQ